MSEVKVLKNKVKSLRNVAKMLLADLEGITKEKLRSVKLARMILGGNLRYVNGDKKIVVISRKGKDIGFVQREKGKWVSYSGNFKKKSVKKLKGKEKSLREAVVKLKQDP